MKRIEKIWYTKSTWAFVLWPFSLIYQSISILRRAYLTTFKQKIFPIPIIVVGNLTVGGVGKTPLVISLIEACQKKGLRPAVISRGYKAFNKNFPHLVTEKDEASFIGDEPYLIAQMTGCPVVIAPKRIEAVDYLIKHKLCDLIISDDGLQHYALARQLEMIVIDGQRGFGNGFYCPAGPLRENKKRLKNQQFIIINGESSHPSLTHLTDFFSMHCEPKALTRLTNGETVHQSELNEPIAALAGIGNPSRFFNTLSDLNISYKAYVFPDHHAFQSKDFHFKERTVIMTAKDAVKCKGFAKESWYFLPIEAKLSEPFWDKFWLAMKDLL